MSELSNLTIETIFTKGDDIALGELGILLVAELFCVLLIIILFRTYPFHIHLWILMMNLVITIMFYCGLRIILIFENLYKIGVPPQALAWLHMLRYIAIFQESFTVFCVVAERSMAAKFSKKYERVKLNVIPVCVIFLGWASTTVLVIYSLHFFVIPFIVILGVVLFVWMFSIIAMIILYFRLRQKRFQRMQRVIAKRQTLSKRYQIKENIKSTKFLLPVITFLTVTACTCMIFLLLSYPAMLLTIRFFDFAISIRSLILPIVVARGHCAFRTHLAALLATATHLISNSETDTFQSRATRSGTRSTGQVYAVMSAVDMHFQSLRNAWEMTQSLSRN